MASYKVFIKNTAEKELRNIPQPFLPQIIQKIKALSESPRPFGVQLLKGEKQT